MKWMDQTKLFREIRLLVYLAYSDMISDQFVVTVLTVTHLWLWIPSIHRNQAIQSEEITQLSPLPFPDFLQQTHTAIMSKKWVNQMSNRSWKLLCRSDEMRRSFRKSIPVVCGNETCLMVLECNVSRVEESERLEEQNKSQIPGVISSSPDLLKTLRCKRNVLSGNFIER